MGGIIVKRFFLVEDDESICNKLIQALSRIPVF